MKVLHSGEWADVLDPWRAPEEARIEVHAWLSLGPLTQLYIEPRASLRTLLDYGKEIGALQVVRKVASRLRERGRSLKWVACGLGRVVEAPGFESGAPVAFFAPRVPEAAERVVVPLAFVRSWPEAMPSRFRQVSSFAGGRFWGDLGDWQREAGRSLEGADQLMDRVAATLAGQNWEGVEPVPFAFTEVCERRGELQRGSGLTASVVGWGHHARTAIVPNLPAEIAVGWVHELEPLLAEAADGVLVDTAPILRDEEKPDIVFASGFHATHAPIAVAALRRGAWVVSEKPVATSREDLRALLDAWREPSRYFAAFHKRYSPFNPWLRSDLDLENSSPMSYYCIAHEISLPERHWYRWPSSGSRILSNGCHWIDHFLFLNDFAEVDHFDARAVGSGEHLCEVTLANGAFFHMIITDRGSDRLGTREHVEIRTAGRTAMIDDGQEYQAETDSRLIRRGRFNKLAAHAAMYHEIGTRIVNGTAGDSKESVQRSAKLVLDLEEGLR